MRNGFARLESRVEQLVEGAFARLFAGRLQARDVVLALARAMEDGAAAQGDGALRAPEVYRVRLNPQDAEALAGVESGVTGQLADDLIVLARDAGLTLSRRPEVRLVPEAGLAPCAVVVEIDPPAAVLRGDTQAGLPALPVGAAAEAAPPAFLIVNGDRHLPLSGSVMTIGRRLESQIVLEDPRVSRTHAQIRQRHGRWVLFDADSSGGTWVNGEAVREWVLRPGDVISLAGVSLIYGEEDAYPHPHPQPLCQGERGAETGGTRPALTPGPSPKGRGE